MSETTPRLEPRELVVLADDFDGLVTWYVDALGFRETKRFDDGYRYANLETESGIRLGIAPAKEVGIEPGDRSKNTIILQVVAADVRALLDHVQAAGGAATLGPSFDEKGRFWFGAFTDPEGNPIWVVDENCP